MISGSIADQGLPTKIFEYQALRKPIICISSGEPGKYILETKSGLVTNSRNPQELSQLILRLVNDDSLAKKLGENGYDNIKNNQTIEIIGKRLMSVIRKCV